MTSYNPSQGWQRYTWIAYGLLVALYATIFAFWQVDPVPWGTHLAAVTVWALSLFPLAIWNRGAGTRAPMVELIILAFGAAYSLPVYLIPHKMMIASKEVPLAWDGMTEAVVWAGAGIGGIIAGYYVILALDHRIKLPVLDLKFSEEGYSRYIGFALVIGILTETAVAFTGFNAEAYSAIIRLLLTQATIGLILLAYRTVAPDTKAKDWTFFWLYLFFATLLGLSSGMMESALIPLVLVLIVWWQARQQFPFKLAVFIALFFVVLNPIKSEYRNLVWFGDYQSASIVERLGAWFEAADNIAHDRRTLSRDADDLTGVSGAVSRVDLLHKFAYVRMLTPGVVPYFEGATYGYLWYTWVPRFIWPSKPLATEANDMIDYSYDLRFANQESKGTNIGIGQIAEAYANYGVGGILLVMFLEGAFFGLLDRVLNGPRSVGGRAIYLAVMVLFLNGIGAPTVILVGNVIQIIAASAFAMTLLAIGGRKLAQPIDVMPRSAADLPRA